MVDKCVFAGPTATPLSRAASLREILALDVRDLLHPDFREFVQPRINLVYGRKYKKFQEIKIVRLDGHPVDLEIMALAITYQGLPAIQVVLRDMTPRQLAEETVRRSEGRLRQVDKLEALVNLAGGLAHDFNNMLMAILGHISVWRLGPPRAKKSYRTDCRLRNMAVTRPNLWPSSS
jgi:two-component system cell cycle sensor histidine kinase/response regulator CckA